MSALNMLLVERGHPATRAAHANEALRMLHERESNFDLVSSDVVMPGTTGLELATEIRRRWSDLPVVLTSSYSHVPVDQHSQAFELLHKPDSVRELTALFEQAVPAENSTEG